MLPGTADVTVFFRNTFSRSHPSVSCRLYDDHLVLPTRRVQGVPLAVLVRTFKTKMPRHCMFLCIDGSRGSTPSPSRPKFLCFHALFWRPQPGNPGSATGMVESEKNCSHYITLRKHVWISTKFRVSKNSKISAPDEETSPGTRPNGTKEQVKWQYLSKSARVDCCNTCCPVHSCQKTKFATLTQINFQFSQW